MKGRFALLAATILILGGGCSDPKFDVVVEELANLQAEVTDLKERLAQIEDADYLTAETDPVFASSAAADISADQVDDWDDAHSWGDHAQEGYLDEEEDPVFLASDVADVDLLDLEDWHEAYSWGDHAHEQYMTPGDEQDPIATAMGYVTATDLDDTLAELENCPPGYVATLLPEGVVECEDLSNGDTVVKVADFWIDKYEGTLWDDPDCTSTSGGPYGSFVDDYIPEFPDTGNWELPLYACSVPGELPGRWVTWFQAQQSCAVVGKTLCSNAQWQIAAAGTPDDTTCNIDHGAVENTGANAGCESLWGVADAVGNVAEWTALWGVHPGWNGAGSNMTSEYGSDYYAAGGPSWSTGMDPYGSAGSWRTYSPAFADDGLPTGSGYGPAAAARGGSYQASTGAGVFNMYLKRGPSNAADIIGVRCCINR